MPGTDVGTGATVAFGTSSFTAQYTNISWSGIAREALQSSHLGTTGYHTFVPPDLTDPGELSLEIFFNPDAQPPIRGAAETVTVTAPVSTGYMTGTSWAASCFVTNFEFGIPLEELMTGTITLKVSGTITVTSGTT